MKSENQMIAETILEQLGGNKFKAMTGAHSFTTSGPKNSLGFKFPNGKNKTFACFITLEPNDTYKMEFYARKGRYDFEKSKEYNDVYFDMLQDLFTEETGLYTSL